MKRRLTLICGLFLCTSTAMADNAPSVEDYRQELADLHVLRDYRAGKNSFVIGLETICGKPRHVRRGDRKTVLDLTGTGSLRHIWETHGDVPPAFTVEMFVDGETTPSIRGKLIDLINAAQQCDQPFVMNPGGVIAKGSHNLYIPVPFEHSLRVDLVMHEDPGMIFMQLDWRLEDASLNGVRLKQTGENDKLRLSYTGLDYLPDKKQIEHASLTTRRATLKQAGKLKIDGSGIIRSLKVDPVSPDAMMKIRFDGEATAAVDVRLADFFGPFTGVALNNNTCYLPMPFKNGAVIELSNSAPQTAVTIEYEEVQSFSPDWGYFHAKWVQDENTLGYRPFQTLYTRGRGHWIGMSLYDTHHDHGGGDFAVIDGETADPAHLHGINGEDYFSFAFFGQGKNFPYSEAFANEVGRNRIHIENPYPFEQSLHTSWGAKPGIQPRCVSFWYQDTPADRTLQPEQTKGLMWQVFGPREVKALLPDGNTPDVSDPQKLFAVLPSVDELDAGETLRVERVLWKPLVGKLEGWAKQQAIGPHLNLMYIYHHSDMGGDPHMGYDPRAMMASTNLKSASARDVMLQLSYDDPILVSLNGEEIHNDMTLREGFTTASIKTRLQKGDNRILVKLLDTPNVNTCWAGITLRVVDE